METAVLKDYLAALLDRYKAIYTTGELRKHIKSQIDKLHGANGKTIPRPEPPTLVDNSEAVAEIHKVSIGIVVGLIFAGLIVVGFIGGFAGADTLGAWIPLYILGVSPGIVYAFWQGISGSKAKSESRENAAADFEDAKKNYAIALANYEKRLEELPAKLELNNAAINSLKQEDKQLESVISGANGVIAELYGKDVVFEKYRHFVAIATFYEYLMSGRCDTLE
ncbi:MAG: hypothetical protein LBU94_01895, partial [Clostridiales bacterium]|nr:hypothetical protein [Clostridiales bacterium]